MSDKPSELLCFNFNQDNSCLAVGTTNGFRIFKTIPFGECLSQGDGGIGIVEMLFSTNLVALVGAGDQPALSPRRLRLWNTNSKSVVCDLNFLTSILAVKMNKKRLVVVLERKVHIFSLSPLQFLHSIDTPRNTRGVCALSWHAEEGHHSYLAVSGTGGGVGGASTQSSSGDASGSVCVYDALSLHVVGVIPAHNSPLACVALSPSGSLLATTSEKGTVVRLFALPSLERICSFRRGSKPTTVHSVSFNAAATMLCVASDSPTIHIFKIPTKSDSDNERGRHDSIDSGSYPAGPQSTHSGGSGGTPSQTASSSSSPGFALLTSSMHSLGLSSFLSDVVDPSRNFAHIRLPSPSHHHHHHSSPHHQSSTASGSNSGHAPAKTRRCVCGIDDQSSSVVVVSGEGVVSRYNLDPVKGGACVLLEEFRIPLGHGDGQLNAAFV